LEISVHFVHPLEACIEEEDEDSSIPSHL
jgi:hypothetical protein